VPAETHSHGPRPERREVADLVADRLAELLGRDPDDIRPELRLRDDLDADDLVVLDLVEAVEQELGERMVGLTLDDDALAELVTVGDTIDCVCEHLGVEPAQ
jgi:acyl carrier protein